MIPEKIQKMIDDGKRRTEVLQAVALHLLETNDYVTGPMVKRIFDGKFPYHADAVSHMFYKNERFKRLEEKVCDDDSIQSIWAYVSANEKPKPDPDPPADDELENLVKYGTFQDFVMRYCSSHPQEHFSASDIYERLKGKWRRERSLHDVNACLTRLRKVGLLIPLTKPVRGVPVVNRLATEEEIKNFVPEKQKKRIAAEHGMAKDHSEEGKRQVAEVMKVKDEFINTLKGRIEEQDKQLDLLKDQNPEDFIEVMEENEELKKLLKEEREKDPMDMELDAVRIGEFIIAKVKDMESQMQKMGDEVSRLQDAIKGHIVERDKERSHHKQQLANLNQKLIAANKGRESQQSGWKLGDVAAINGAKRD